MRRERRQAPDTFSVASVGRVAFGPAKVGVASRGTAMAQEVTTGAAASGAAKQKSDSTSASVPPPSAFERHFVVAEIGALWGLSGDAVRKLFRGAPKIQ